MPDLEIGWCTCNPRHGYGFCWGTESKTRTPTPTKPINLPRGFPYPCQSLITDNNFHHPFEPSGHCWVIFQIFFMLKGFFPCPVDHVKYYISGKMCSTDFFSFFFSHPPIAFLEHLEPFYMYYFFLGYTGSLREIF